MIVEKKTRRQSKLKISGEILFSSWALIYKTFINYQKGADEKVESGETKYQVESTK
jgi:hypothetical protein